MRLATSQLLLLTAVVLGGCNRLNYEIQERIGREKRDILVSRLEGGRRDQQRAKEQIQTTLEAFHQVTGFDGGDFEKFYKKLANEFEQSEDRAKDLRNQIASIDQVATDLFQEWRDELNQMHNGELKNKSAVLLRNAESRYGATITRMRASERKLEPVLQTFRDQVLYLKHNLNARAITSLKTNAASIDRDVAALVADLDVSIKEAGSFIATLKAE
jgi:predicted  nucleic acid-binding Zn-ribbon protein